MMKQRIVLVLLLLTLAGPATAGNPWFRAVSPHFVVSGNVPAARVTDVARRLEQFREVLTLVFPETRVATRPLFVVVFDSDLAFHEFKPLRNGRPSPVAGYFAGSADGGAVALRLDRGEESYPIAFHEYSHLFFADAVRGLPMWLREGIAEYYSTVTVEEGATRTALIGLPVRGYVEALPTRWLPLAEVLDAKEPLWNNRMSAAIYYAHSWALVHYLASVAGPAGIGELVKRVAAGRPGREGFEAAFGPIDSVEQALRDYVRAGNYRHHRHPLPALDTAAIGTPRQLTPAEVEATVAVPLIRMGRFKEAARHVEAALKADPFLTEAHVARGLLDLQQGNALAAERSLRGAVAHDPADPLAAFYWGRALLESPAPDPLLLEQARRALASALPATNPPADALALLGLLESETGRQEEAEATLRRALALAPGRGRTSLMLARVLAKRGKLAEARAILEAILARPSDADEATLARRQLERLK